ncbi:MAG: caspase family protein [Halieaceae bacterium]
MIIAVVSRFSSNRLRACITLVLSLVLVACADQPKVAAVPENAKVDDLYIVDCLLPGQLRQLGNTSYMTPRRPVRTTAQDCRIRGGEYVAYDRADYKTALKIWLPAAEGGDADAQNTVGEIFEQGLGTKPNYEVAVLWYRKAAQQGHKSAQFNLGTMYETGRGVPEDRVEALNWYRLAWGVSDDSLTYRSSAEEALLSQAQKNARTQEVMAEQLAVAEARADAAVAKNSQSAAALERERAELAQTEAELQQTSEALAQTSQALAIADEVSSGGRNFGRYYALLIGNENYQHLDDLGTPLSDVQRIASVLQDEYSFQVQMLTNGDDASLLQAINRLNDTLEEGDNLLIYYSGHGNRRQSGAFEAGYWLPVNAQQPPNDTYWVPTEQVSGHLARLKATRIMVVSDSSFAGLLADNPAFLLASDPAQLNSDAYVALRFPNRSRLLMTSGNDYPLPRADLQGTSVFADALVDTLRGNNSVMTAPALFLSMIQKLESRQPDLSPEFKAIKRAGDEVGDFFFVAR